MIDVIVLAAAFATGTWYVGWWSIPVLALAWGWWVGSSRRPAARSALAAPLAWIGFLVNDAVVGPAGRLARTLGTAMHVPPLVLIIVTLVFPAVLAWSAATVGAEVAPASPADPT
jgi:hypothetical protein